MTTSGRSKPSDSAALRAARKTRNHALWERNQLLKLWIQATGLMAHLEPPARGPELLFPVVLCVHTPAGQLTWRLTEEEREDFAHLPENGVSHYDGAVGGERDRRLEQLVALAIDAPEASSRDAEPFLQSSPLTFEQVALIRDAVHAAVEAKPTAGTYAVFVGPTHGSVRLTRYLPRFVARLPRDGQGRLIDPRDGWIYAGTVEKA